MNKEEMRKEYLHFQVSCMSLGNDKEKIEQFFKGGEYCKKCKGKLKKREIKRCEDDEIGLCDGCRVETMQLSFFEMFTERMEEKNEVNFKRNSKEYIQITRW
jgi:CRISPR/Cas system-associated protein Cas10 (large subunit of type III CRISPR-Cas system)